VLSRQNGWAQIQEPAGWVYDPYLAYDGTPAAPVPASPAEGGTLTYGVCNTSGLNVRSGPANTYSIVGGLTYGQRVRILERREGWAQIEAPQGWCNENYLSFN
jgi:mannosyl-glycoprotein endo-beta-N-acetylglucosaminidase